MPKTRLIAALVFMGMIFHFRLSMAGEAPPSNGDLKIYKSHLAQIEESIKLTKEQIFSAQTTKFLPDMYYMLAELMTDRGNYLYIIKKESNKGVPESELDLTAEKRAKLEAVEAFKQLIQRYPNYKSIDKVLYVVGQELKALGELDQALQFYKKSAEQFPKSNFATKSLMEIGNIFYEKKDFDFALDQYRKAALTAQGVDALLLFNKMASCYSFKGEWRKAIDQYFLVIRKPLTSDKESAEAKEDALVQSVWPLLELPANELPNLKRASDIISFYKISAFDPQSYRRTLERLSKRFEFKKKEAESAEVSLELFRIIKDSKSKKERFENFFNVTRSNTNFIYPHWLPKEIANMLLSGSNSTSNEEREKDKLKYEEAFRHIITSQHKSAILTKRTADIVKTADGYEHYLSVYPKGTHRLEMLKNKAELEFLGNRFVDAAYDYLTIAKAPTEQKGTGAKEYLVSSLDSSLKAMSENEEDLLTKVRSRELYRKAGLRFKKKYPNDPKIAEIDFNKAKALYDDQKLGDAAKLLIRFVHRYPKAEQISSAVVLALDCYYLQEKMDQVAQVGKALLAVSGLSSQIKDQIRSSVQQAQLKNVRSLAGNFSSKSYAAEFVAFAKKNKNSTMGEQALYEAFLSLKAGTKEQALDIGEDYMATYGTNPRAKEVLLQMSQLSLVMLDFVRAASYMAAYAQRFPNDPSSNELLEQAASLFAMAGKTDQAYSIFQMLGQKNRGVAVLSQWGRWNELEKRATQINGFLGVYYQGLAQFRSGKEQEGLQMMRKVLESSASTDEEKELWSHAGVILAEDAARSFYQNTKPGVFSMDVLQGILEQHQFITSITQNVVSNGGGIWRLAALSIDASINNHLSQFLNKAPAPAGVNLAQFKKIIEPQVAQYKANATQSFSTCLEVGEENEIASGFVLACRNHSLWTEEKDTFQMRTTRLLASSNSSALREQIKANPRSSELIKKYAVERMAAKDESTALMLLTRARDLDPASAEIDALKGIAWLRLGASVNAMLAAKEALAKDASEPSALEVKKVLFKRFGYAKKLALLNANGGGKKSPYNNLIPR